MISNVLILKPVQYKCSISGVTEMNSAHVAKLSKMEFINKLNDIQRNNKKVRILICELLVFLGSIILKSI